MGLLCNRTLSSHKTLLKKNYWYGKFPQSVQRNLKTSSKTLFLNTSNGIYTNKKNKCKMTRKAYCCIEEWFLFLSHFPQLAYIVFLIRLFFKKSNNLSIYIYLSFWDKLFIILCPEKRPEMAEAKWHVLTLTWKSPWQGGQLLTASMQSKKMDGFPFSKTKNSKTATAWSPWKLGTCVCLQLYGLYT